MDVDLEAGSLPAVDTGRHLLGQRPRWSQSEYSRVAFKQTQGGPSPPDLGSSLSGDCTPEVAPQEAAGLRALPWVWAEQRPPSPEDGEGVGARLRCSLLIQRKPGPSTHRRQRHC